MTVSMATAVEAGKVCPYCRFALKAGVEIERCASCDSVYHDECWRDGDGCSVFGCPGAGAADGSAMAPPTAAQRFPPPAVPAGTFPPPVPPGGGGQRGLLLGVIVVLAVLVAALGGYVLTSSRDDQRASSGESAEAQAPPAATSTPAATRVEDASTPEPAVEVPPAPTSSPATTRNERAAQRIEAIISFSLDGRSAVREGRYAAAVANRRSVLRRLDAIEGSSGRVLDAKRTLTRAMQASLASDIAYQEGRSAAASDAEATRLKAAFVRQWSPIAAEYGVRQYSAGDI